MKIIFLDFDGVLNHEAFYEKRQQIGLEKYPTYPLSLCEIDPEGIKILNYIIGETGAKVVISSTWRHGRTIEELQNMLNYFEFQGDIIDITPSFDTRCSLRGNEILAWVKNNEELLGKKYHEFENYVIFDDDSDMLYWQKDNFLHIDRWVGLTMKNAFDAIRILNRGAGMHIL
jgi:hypothetical protein